MENQEAKDKIIKARVTLQKENPFFAYISLYLTPIEKADIETIGVNKEGDMFYNPEFVNKLSKNELKGVICHEVMHVALEHLKYLQGKDTILANIAQDIVINNILVTNDFELPKEGIIPHNNSITIGNVTIQNIDKHCWESIYHILCKKLPKKKVSYCGIDKHIRPNSPDEEQTKENDSGNGKNKKQWSKILNEAYIYAKLQGHAPAGIDKYIEELTYPKLNWKELLYKYLIRSIPYDFSYTKPSKKGLSSGVYLPSIIKEELEVLVAIDTSGSMEKEELIEGVSEVLGIFKAYTNVKITALMCDTEVFVQQINSEKDIRHINLKGGGGTDFRPVFNWIKENKPQAQLLIFFTDGYGDFPEKAPQIKTIWCISHASRVETVPFGTLIKL